MRLRHRTIVHFGAVLLLAGMLCAPWQFFDGSPAAVLWALLGFSGYGGGGYRVI